MEKTRMSIKVNLLTYIPVDMAEAAPEHSIVISGDALIVLFTSSATCLLVLVLSMRQVWVAPQDLAASNLVLSKSRMHNNGPK